MRLPRFRTHEDRIREEYADLIGDAWDGLSNQTKSELIISNPELYFPLATLARQAQVRRWGRGI